MSTALNVALYLREKNIPNLSLATRGVLFTLLFRVGQNEFTWVDQQTLATECQVNASNIRTHMKKLQEIGLIIIQKDPKDKRRNLYRPAEFLLDKKVIHKNDCAKNYRSKSSGIIENTARNQAVNTARNQAVLFCSTDKQPNDYKDKKYRYISPKYKYENKSVIKQKRYFFYNSMDNYENLSEVQRQKGMRHISEIKAQLGGKFYEQPNPV